MQNQERTYETIALAEIAYHGNDLSVMDCLWDTYNAALCIESRGKSNTDLIAQVEIYDQIWYLRHMPLDRKHSNEAIELVKEMITLLEEIPDGCAETFLAKRSITKHCEQCLGSLLSR